MSQRSSAYYPLKAESEVRLKYGDRLGVVQVEQQGSRQHVFAATGLSGFVNLYLKSGWDVQGSYIVTRCSSSGTGFVCDLMPADMLEADSEKLEIEAKRILG